MKTLPQKAAQKVFDQYGENVDMNSIYGEIEKAMSEIVYGHPDHKGNV
jgi:hypothetical protein